MNNNLQFLKTLSRIYFVWAIITTLAWMAGAYSIWTEMFAQAIFPFICVILSCENVKKSSVVTLVLIISAIEMITCVAGAFMILFGALPEVIANPGSVLFGMFVTHGVLILLSHSQS